MGFKKEKLIQRNPISGDWERNDIPPGEHSPTDLKARAKAAHEALEQAIAKDSHGMQGSTIDHPATDIAKKRMRNEDGRSQPGQNTMAQPSSKDAAKLQKGEKQLA